MFRHSIFLRVIATIVVIGLLVGAGAVAYRAGWMQGYQTAALTTAKGGTTVQTPAPFPAMPYFGPGYGYGYGYGFPGFFHPFGLFFGFGLFLLAFLTVGFFIRMMFFRRFAGHMHRGEWRHGMWDEGKEPPSPSEKSEEQPK